MKPKEKCLAKLDVIADMPGQRISENYKRRQFSALHQRLRGPMARRLTTNQEIPGSTPGVIIVFADIWHVDNAWSM